MATLTERLLLLIDARSGGAIKEIKDVDRALGDLDDQAGKTGTKLDSLGAAVGVSGQALKAGLVTGAGAAAVALVSFGKQAVEAASSLEEQMAAVQTSFGSAADSVIEFAQSANSLGLSDRAALQAASSFGTLFLNIGITEDAAAQMSIRMVQLAADLASFKDTSIEDALAAINSGLVGETEPLRRFGVLLNEAALKAQALSDGLIRNTTAALTPAVRAQAAYNAILAQTTIAQGDVERTGGSLAGQQRQLAANLEDLSATLGQSLLPAVADVVAGINDSIAAMSSLVGAIRDVGDALPDVVSDMARFGAVLSGPVLAGLKLGPSVMGGFASGLDSITSAGDGVIRMLEQNQAAMTAYFGAINQGRAATQAYAQVTSSSVRADLDAAAAHRGRSGAVRRLTQNLLAAVAAQAAYNAQAGKPGAAAASLLQGVVDAERAARDIGSSIGGGVTAGLDEADVGAYLESVARKAAQDFQDVFAGISASLSVGSADRQVRDATENLAALRSEFRGIGAEIKVQQGVRDALAEAAAAVTPEEQVAIEQAERNLERVRMAYLGLRETIAPSSFSGEDTIIEQIAPTATLAELQVAEQQLADVRTRATGPTRELEEAQRELDKLRERAAELPREIADAESRLVEVQLARVEAQQRLIEQGRELSDQGAEITQQFLDLAAAVGLSGQAIDGYIGMLRNAASAAGLVDVFGNGLLFRSPEEAEAIRNFIRAQAGVPQFANGGVVPGPLGSPQLVMAHAGETILPTHRGGGLVLGGVSISVSGAGDPQAVARAVRNELLKLQRRNGSLGFN